MDESTLNKLEFPRVRELLAAHCSCGLGKSMAHRLRPAANPERVRHWLDQVRQMMEAEIAVGLPPLGGISDIAPLVRKAEQPAGLEAEELCKVAESMAATRTLQIWFGKLKEIANESAGGRGGRSSRPSAPGGSALSSTAATSTAIPPQPGMPYPLLETLGERIGDFGALADEIGQCIDSRGRVLDDASPKLKSIRGAIEKTRTQIGVMFERLLRQQRIVKLLQYSNLTFHEDRCVLPLKAEHRGRVPGIVHRSSDSGATLFVEPSEAVEMNNTIIRLRDDERKEINLILSRLSRLVYLNEAGILKSLEALTVLDLICAKVRYAKRWDAICPEIRDGYVLHLNRARHPLLLALFANDGGPNGPGTSGHETEDPSDTRPSAARHSPSRQVVPIDARLGDDFDLLVITGPNTGGKTAAIKTLGLLAIMVQAGIPVPVGRGSAFPVYKQVFIDIGDEQSLQQSLSTFSSHMSNILSILRRAGHGSLVLLDELGAGTDPDEGAAIGRAVIDELLRLECQAVVSTHLSALKAAAFTAERVDNASVEFDVDTLQPTYHLRLGEPGNSNALIIAQRLGMPKRLVEWARGHLDDRHRALHKAIAGTLDSRRKAEQARLDAGAAQQQAEEARKQADEEQRRLTRKQADYESWIRWINQLKPGDAVFVKTFDKAGQVVRMQLHKQSALVSAGMMHIEVRLDDLRPDTTK